MGKANNQSKKNSYTDNKIFYWDILSSIVGYQLLKLWDKKNDIGTKVCKALNEAGIKGIAAFVERNKNIDIWDKNMEHFLHKLYNISNLNIPKVIIGQSGSGKESMARALHYLKFFNGAKNDNGFHIFDASAVNPGTINAELFGHLKGAYTGAIAAKEGIIKKAENNTLFIDELGKLPIDIQAKLLRVIEYKTFKKLGSETEEKLKDINFIISLQPSDLAEDKILLDLKNRLNLHLAIRLPSLTERLRRDKGLIYDVFRQILERPDICKAIVAADLKTVARGYGKDSKEAAVNLIRAIKNVEDYQKQRKSIDKKYTEFEISTSVYKYLSSYEGYEDKNFRELYNILESALLMAITNHRYKIIMEDLDTLVMNFENHKNEKEKIVLDDAYEKIKNIPLKEILDYGESLKKEIICKKVEDIFRVSKNIKNELIREGLPEKEYVNYYNKLQRITGPLKTIKKQAMKAFR